MPHNRTRIWVGLAIAVVTIPAVGQFLYRPQADGLRAQALNDSGRWTASNGFIDTHGNARLAARPPQRDYLSEVRTSLGRNAPAYIAPSIAPEEYIANDPMFDLDPVDAYADDEYAASNVRDLPDAVADLAPREAVVPEAATEGVPTEIPEAAAAQEPPASAEGLSDRQLYTLVVDGLSVDDRDQFVRAWAVMTPDQRADLLDDFRANLNGAQ